MPLFEYHCNNCDINFETLVIDNTLDITCTSCNSKSIDKLFSTFGVNSGNENNISDNDITNYSGSCCTHTGCGCS